jgi:hypothetical protein
MIAIPHRYGLQTRRRAQDDLLHAGEDNTGLGYRYPVPQRMQYMNDNLPPSWPDGLWFVWVWREGRSSICKVLSTRA